MASAILVVRDQTDFAARLSGALKSAGVQAEIVIAGDVNAAAHSFDDGGRFGDALPAMVIVPPVVDVIGLLARLRSRKRTRSVQVFVIRALPIAEPA
jgi:CheY-like chemotaxis protein